MRVLFMGTPEFAIPSLDAIHREHTLVAVITSPDKPAGRGHQLQVSAVKTYCQDHKIPLLQPKNLKSEKFLNRVKALDPDINVIVAFRMLPIALINLPKFGSLNLHASLLPKYRGAAPIQRAIMAGETKTGLTVFRLAHEIDTGDLVNSLEIPIGSDVTGGELHDKMAQAGAPLLIKSLQEIESNTANYKTQNDELVSAAPKIFKEDCRIDWTKSTVVVYNLIRALIPYPCAWFMDKGKTYKIHKASKINQTHTLIPGEWLIDTDSLKIACSDGYIEIFEIQAEGKRKVTAREFINGLQNRDIRKLE
jgi:methionyl-tRNA formyltransferase